MASNVVTLPLEIIEYILEDDRLTLLDVVRFSLTCKQLYRVVSNSNKLWRTKFFQRWPELKDECHGSEKLEKFAVNWRETIESSLISRRKLLSQLSTMSCKYYGKEVLNDSDLKEFDWLIRPEQGARPLVYHVLVNELIRSLIRPKETSNLTDRYYALKVVNYLRQHYLKSEWHRFISLPPSEQTLERGAILVAQWSQPEKYVNRVSQRLDNIAEETKEVLKAKYPGHSIFSTPTEQFALWKNNNITDNQWSVPETRQVLGALSKVLFSTLGFSASPELYYSSKASFIDVVLETKYGTPIILEIIFESVARRLGVRCEPICFPSHFLLRWKESYAPEYKDTENFYIDVVNGGEFLTKKDCPKVGGVAKCPIERYNVHEAAPAVEAITRMASNLQMAARQVTHVLHNYSRVESLVSALELWHMVQPNNNTVTELVNMHRHQMGFADMGSIKPKRRLPYLKYGVGHVMEHKNDGYLCVIIGWEVRYLDEDLWSIGSLDDDDISYYHVLINDGVAVCLNQGEIVLSMDPKPINHYATGRYFSKFNGIHYVPNEELETEYPEDQEVRDRYLICLRNKK